MSALARTFAEAKAERTRALRAANDGRGREGRTLWTPEDREAVRRADAAYLAASEALAADLVRLRKVGQ